MTTKRFVQGLIVTVALCLSAAAGRAQENRIFLMGGAASLGDKSSFTELYIPFTTSYANGGRGIVGVEVPLKKSKIFGFEGSYGFGQNNLKLANLEYTYAPVTSYGLRNNRVSGDLVVRSPSAYHGAHPYVVFGVEYDLFSATGAAQSLATTEGFAAEPTAKLSSNGSVGVNFGGGIDYKVTSRFDLRLDVREHIASSPTFGLPTSEPTTAGLAWFPVTGSAHILEYSIGITYRFGKQGPGEAKPPKSHSERTSRAKPSNRPTAWPQM